MNSFANSASKPRVLVLGGTGFIGKALVRTLSEAGYRVTVLSRHASRHQDLATQTSAQVLDLPISADTHGPESSPSLVELLQGHVALVNLVGILNEPRHTGEVFEQVHVDF